MATVLLVACQGTESGPPVDPTGVDPCELVTAREIEDAAGRSLEPQPEEPGVGEARDCGFGTELAPRVNVGVRQTPIERGELRPFVDDFIESVPGEPELRAVPSPGDEAYAIVLPAGEETDISHVTLFVRARGVLLSVSMNLEAPGDEVLEGAVGLAQAAVGRL